MTNDPIETTSESSPAEQSARLRFVYWLKRLGLAGFLFFLIKGLLWIMIMVLVAKGCL
jgi:hypothetical protein